MKGIRHSKSGIACGKLGKQEFSCQSGDVLVRIALFALLADFLGELCGKRFLTAWFAKKRTLARRDS